MSDETSNLNQKFSKEELNQKTKKELIKYVKDNNINCNRKNKQTLIDGILQHQSNLS